MQLLPINLNLWGIGGSKGELRHVPTPKGPNSLILTYNFFFKMKLRKQLVPPLWEILDRHLGDPRAHPSHTKFIHLATGYRATNYT